MIEKADRQEPEDERPGLPPEPDVLVQRGDSRGNDVDGRERPFRL